MVRKQTHYDRIQVRSTLVVDSLLDDEVTVDGMMPIIFWIID